LHARHAAGRGARRSISCQKYIIDHPFGIAQLDAFGTEAGEEQARQIPVMRCGKCGVLTEKLPGVAGSS
jgi:hypothetical protein